MMDKLAAYLLQKETITGEEFMAILQDKDPEEVVKDGEPQTVDTSSMESQPATESLPNT